MKTNTTHTTVIDSETLRLDVTLIIARHFPHLTTGEHAHLTALVLEDVFFAAAWTQNTHFDEDNTDLVLMRLAAHPNTPTVIVTGLAEYGSDYVRRQAAWNSTLPPAMLQRLLHDEDEYVRAAALLNPRTPVEVLRHAAQTGTEEEQCAVAENPLTPVDVLIHLAGETDSAFVLHYVAANPHTPPGIAAQAALRARALEEEVTS